VRCADRLLRLSPNNAEALRDRGLGYLRLGHTHGARQDLARYLQLHPDAGDSDAVRERLIGLGRHARPH
jgi:regulator of sirC expression with transglutaminase-like and TPR domain